MAGVNYYGQVRKLLEHGHRRKVKGVSGVIIECAYTAFAKYNALVAAGHYVFRAHQQLFKRVCKAALEQNGLVQLAELFEQFKVLHIPCADLYQINVLEQRQVVNAHYFRNYGKSGLLTGKLQKLYARGLKPLEVIGRGTRLERAAAQHIRAAGLYRAGNGKYLLLVFNGAGARYHAEVAAADLNVANVYDHVVRMELPVAALERLGHALYGIHYAKAGYKVHVYAARVAYQAKNRLELAFGNVYAQSLTLQPIDELILLFLVRPVLKYNNHGIYPPKILFRIRLQLCNKKAAPV